VTSNYVLLETAALLQRRIGLPAVRDLDERIAPLLTVRWITEPLHRRAMDRLIRADRRGVSLVDCTSFEVMEAEGIAEAFALDRDFAAAGFRLVPR
jgi:predicted nucleic acid-binding protein